MKKILFTLALLVSFSSFGQIDREYMRYFNEGDKKFDNGDYYGAIYEYTKSIETGNFHPPSLTNRALAKAKIGDLKSAFDDINYAIEEVPEFGPLYFYRGLIKLEHSKEYYSAISDFMRAIESDNKNGKYFYYLGLTKEQIGDTNSACLDWKKAVELGNTSAANKLAKQCN